MDIFTLSLRFMRLLVYLWSYPFCRPPVGISQKNSLYHLPTSTQKNPDIDRGQCTTCLRKGLIVKYEDNWMCLNCWAPLFHRRKEQLIKLRLQALQEKTQEGKNNGTEFLHFVF